MDQVGSKVVFVVIPLIPLHLLNYPIKLSIRLRGTSRKVHDLPTPASTELPWMRRGSRYGQLPPQILLFPIIKPLYVFQDCAISTPIYVHRGTKRVTASPHHTASGANNTYRYTTHWRYCKTKQFNSLLKNKIVKNRESSVRIPFEGFTLLT